MNEAEFSAVVTGASSGFGRAIAQRLVESGYRVVAVARRAERLAELTDLLGKDRVHAVPLDVRDADAVEKALTTLPEEFAQVRVLVNNAGLSKGFGPIGDARLEHWQEMVDTNVMGVLHCTRAVLPALQRAGDGHIVTIGSIAASYPYMGGNVYGATKAFARQLSLNLRTDLSGSGIRVTCVDPGMAKTEFAMVRFDGDRAKSEALYDGVQPLASEDVAEAVAWCLAQPRHVNVNLIELMPTDQPFGLGFKAPTSR
ncbi:SDR family NAD(P)-dependent oxidoreductase [Stackebrandtia soli]|uniref:SDR family NAD(P)-dependent oxidoreductase n=1 Tax=Stackebrandtia soli TaxID=1892856 RepID=UPI0039E861D8